LISGLPAALLRRWRLSVFGLLLTVALLGGAYVAVPPQYTAKAAVLLVPPSDSVGNNPYLNLGALGGLNNVLAQALTDSSTTDALSAKGLSTNYTITSDAASSGPIVIINGTAKTGAGALAVVNELVARLPTTLQKLQQSAGVISQKSYVTSTILSPPDAPVAVRKSQTRAVIAAGVAGLVLTFLLVAAAERIGIRRREKKANRAAKKAGTGSEPAVASPSGLPAAPGPMTNGSISTTSLRNGANGAPLTAGSAGGRRTNGTNGSANGNRVTPSQEPAGVVSKRQRIRRPSSR
jgi:hypothetical protein